MPVSQVVLADLPAEQHRLAGPWMNRREVHEAAFQALHLHPERLQALEDVAELDAEPLRFSKQVAVPGRVESPVACDRLATVVDELVGVA